MRNYVIRSVTILFITFLIFSCNAQQDKILVKIDRQPVVAGSFYPADKGTLLKMLDDFFSTQLSENEKQPLAVIVPHAGYVFSGGVAAASYKHIDRNRKFKHIFIIASSHTTYFEGASVYSQGDYITPLGKVTVDTLANWLDNKYDFISDFVEPHMGEHSIEVQLPFLQYWLKNDFSIVPIIIGGKSLNTCKKFSNALKKYFNKDNLFVISADFSHFPSYENAIFSDSIIAEAIVSNSPQDFLKAKAKVENKNIPGLSTAACAWTSILTLLKITEANPDVVYQKIEYKNSGDSRYGAKDRVVGYHAINIIENERTADYSKFNLIDEDKIALLQIARKTIQEYIINKHTPIINEDILSPILTTNAGAFVTLKKNGHLRGCIGSFRAESPLFKIVQLMAIASATNDYRFFPVTANEISELEIEISVLTPMQKINSIDEIILGKHGIYIKKGNKSGTFLPQVATDTGWSKEEFLGHCAQDKAGIGWYGWKDAEIFIYEALVFEEQEYKAELK